jgi:tRNA A37 threonylcarbamoyladenosine synthetase subunit TsaC/SUA5/YrdC
MLKNKVFLTQTDTTLGFVSQSLHKLNQIKKRPPSKHYIKALNSLHTLQTFTRVPLKHRKQVRRATKSTFIMPNGFSYRIVRDSHHLLLLNRFKWIYTTSANLSGQTYDESFAKANADVIITPLWSLQQASSIFKLGKRKIQRIR